MFLYHTSPTRNLSLLNEKVPKELSLQTLPIICNKTGLENWFVFARDFGKYCLSESVSQKLGKTRIFHTVLQLEIPVMLHQYSKNFTEKITTKCKHQREQARQHCCKTMGIFSSLLLYLNSKYFVIKYFSSYKRLTTECSTILFNPDWLWDVNKTKDVTGLSSRALHDTKLRSDS